MDLSAYLRQLLRGLVDPSGRAAQRLGDFKALLAADQRAHVLLGRLGALGQGERLADWAAVERDHQELLEEVGAMLAALKALDPLGPDLPARWERRLAQAEPGLIPARPPRPAPPWWLPLAQAAVAPEAQVGGKARGLAQALGILGLEPLPGLVVTSDFFRLFLAHNDLESFIQRHLAALDPRNPEQLAWTSQRLVRQVTRGEIPPWARAEVETALEGALPPGAALAVRSSAVSEDGSSSFAGQYASHLGVARADFWDAWRQVAASKYHERALHYRVSRGLADWETPMAALVLVMVEPQWAGVAYGRDLEDPTGAGLVVQAVPGRGEGLVGGRERPVAIRLDRRPPHARLDDPDRRPEPPAEATTRLARWALALEHALGHPQDLEWALGPDDRLWLLQARPLVMGTEAAQARVCDLSPAADRLLFEGGATAAGGVGAGPLWLAPDLERALRAPEGAVLVAGPADPRLAPALSRLAGLVCQDGGSAGHLATVAREEGLPLLVGATGALEALAPHRGSLVTLHAGGRAVYAGRLDPELTGPCRLTPPPADSPAARRLGRLLAGITPLHLIDPQGPDFTPERATTLHDLIRYAHEMGMRAMFGQGRDLAFKPRGARDLDSPLPLRMLLLDAGGGLRPDAGRSHRVSPELIASVPFQAVYQGLTHPGVDWSGAQPFDWTDYDRVAQGGGIISHRATRFSSFCVLAADYCNLSLKFGYHFTILDSICGGDPGGNHAWLRFAGGGDNPARRVYRARLVELLLVGWGFVAQRQGDLVEGRLQGVGRGRLLEVLDLVGRLLGATRLLDMRLDPGRPLEEYAREFRAGRYHFTGGPRRD